MCLPVGGQIYAQNWVSLSWWAWLGVMYNHCSTILVCLTHQIWATIALPMQIPFFWMEAQLMCYSIFTFGQLFVYKMKMTVEFCRQHTLYASACKMSPDQCAVTDYCGRRRLVDHILRKNCFYFFGQQQTLLWLLWIVESIIICLMWPKVSKKLSCIAIAALPKKFIFAAQIFIALFVNVTVEVNHKKPNQNYFHFSSAWEKCFNLLTGDLVSKSKQM